MKIGLTYTGDNDKHSYYEKWLKQDDAIEIVKLEAPGNDGQGLDRCDGLVLSGGIDIHPKYYNGAVDYDRAPGNGWNAERDAFETALFHKAQERQLPVLAVCRGLQLVNVILGGTLVQDLGKALDEVHESESRYKDGHHSITVEPHTLLHELVPEGSGEVNSAHHQAIKTPGKGLRINARATDGTVEGIEWADKTGKSFLLGVQWHPERMFRFEWQRSPASQKIRDRFIEEIRTSKPGNR